LQLIALFAASITLANCSAMPVEYASDPSTPPADYGVPVSKAFKSSFKDFSSYGNFEISGLRWIHATTGWNWLACVRFDDHGHRRTYTFLIKDNAVVGSRYDILTDQCGAQQYVPFDVTTGTVGSSTPVQQSPLY
jgi:hypothetical protein